MSGTSADGVDAALLQIRGTGEALSWRLLRHETLHYSVKVRDLIRRCSEPGSGDAASICRLNVLLGELFARAVTHVAERAGVEPKSIDLIGSHGQTLQNLPGPVIITGITVRSSLQVGEPAVIAERTGVTTGANFRARDLAAGGRGSPLESYVHFLLFRNRSRGRLVINIGGVASLTAIPANAAADRVLGFDSGPGNMVIAWSRLPHDGRSGDVGSWRTLRTEGQGRGRAPGAPPRSPLPAHAAAQVLRPGGVRAPLPREHPQGERRPPAQRPDRHRHPVHRRVDRLRLPAPRHAAQRVRRGDRIGWRGAQRLPDGTTEGRHPGAVDQGKRRVRSAGG